MDTNVSVSKQFRLAERQSLQFRSEFFNIVNRPNFSNPGVNVDTPNTFGKISSAGEGRIIQFALKLIF